MSAGGIESPARRDLPRADPLPRAGPGTALYVHLPFCAAKCHYCDFFSVPDEGHDIDAMVAAILSEAGHRAPRSPRTLFLGGGTPSLLSVAQLGALLDGLDAITGWRASASEVTAECNPESLDVDKALALLDLGVPRLSIGFQSLDDTTLGLFGRVHSVEDSFRAFDAARAAGIRHLNVDMIYAVPDQTAEQWERDLKRVLALGPEHLSAYNLTFEEDTRFKRWLDQGKLESSAEEVELEMFHATRALTAAAGLEAYEISNHGRTGEACAHNLNYWRNGEYVGIGPGAVSKVGFARAGNPRSIAPYLRRIGAAGHATDWREEPAPATRLAESWWLGLRLAEGVEPETARRASGFGAPESDGTPEPEGIRKPEGTPGPDGAPPDVEATDPALPIADELVGHGLLEVDAAGARAPRYRLSPSGLPLADAVARRFLERLGEG